MYAHCRFVEEEWYKSELLIMKIKFTYLGI